MMNRLLSFLSSILVMVVGLGACTNTTTTVNLPLADDKPTFLFFYTDN